MGPVIPARLVFGSLGNGWPSGSMSYIHIQLDFQGSPILGPLTHTIPNHSHFRIPKDMGIVWEDMGNLPPRGVPCPWESLETPLTYLT